MTYFLLKHYCDAVLKKNFFSKILFVGVFCFWFLLGGKSIAQVCGGKSGIPFLLETFGSGSNVFGNPLPAGITNYPYTANWPPDKYYTISSTSNPNGGGGANWFTERDHTGDPNGYMMVVNSSDASANTEIYRKTITGLCPNTNYTFAAYIANVNTQGAYTSCQKPPASVYAYANMEFKIMDGSTILGSVQTNDIPISTKGKLDWVQYGINIKTGAQTQVDIVMTNLALGGCGNDILIDDISFAVCGPKLNITASPSKPVYCVGENVTLTGTIGAGVYNNPDFQWQLSKDNNVTWTDIASETTKTLTLSNLALSNTATYRLLAAEKGNLGSIKCGIISDTLLIKVVPNPDFTVNSPTICSGKSATLTATLTTPDAGTTYTWTGGAGSGASVTVSPTANPTSYTAVAKDANNCISAQISTVTVNPSPTASAPDVTLCIGETKPLNATGTAATFAWSPAAGLSATTGPTVNANPTVTTTYVLTGTLNSCTTTSNVVVTVNPLPVVTASNNGYCSGGSTTLTASGAASYSWSPATNLSSSNNSQVVANPTTTTTYKVTGTYVSGCFASKDVTVTVFDNPIVTISPSSPTVCIGGSTALAANVTKATGTLDYAWTPADGTLNNTNTANVIAKPTATTTYSLKVTDGNSCSGVATATVNITNNTISVAPHGPICEGDTAHLKAYGASSYLWTPSTTFVKNDGSVVYVKPPSGQVSYDIVGVIPGCANTPSVNVSFTVNTKPVISVTDGKYCEGGNALLKASGNLITSYSWSPAAGLDNTNTFAVSASPLAPAIYKYRVIGTTNDGCADTAFSTVTVNKKPSISINPPLDKICSGGSTTLTALSNGTNPTYVWTASPADASMSSTNNPGISASPLINTTYAVVVTDGNTCTNNKSAVVTVTNPLIQVQTHKDICEGDTAEFRAYGASTYTWAPSLTNSPLSATTPVSSTGDVVGVALPAGIYAYTVTGFIPGCTNIPPQTVNLLVNPKPDVKVSADKPQICLGQSSNLTATNASLYIWKADATLNTTNGSPVVATPLATQPYTVTGIEKGCSTTVSVTVIVNNPPVPFVATPRTICMGDTVHLMAVNNAPIAPLTKYMWNASPDLSSVKDAATVAKPIAVKSVYTVTATDVNTCTASTKVTVTAVKKVIPTISDSVRICKGENAVLTAGGGSTYIWQSNDARTATITVSPTVTTKYKVKIMNTVCTAYDSVKVIIKDPLTPALYVPSAFTPNDDDVNDVFKVYSNTDLTSLNVFVFDRWGEKIAEWHTLNEGWDGSIHGTRAQLGVYVYTVTAKSECETKIRAPQVGTVTLVR